MSDSRLERIENKLDKIADKISAIEIDVAKQEQKIFKRMISMLVLIGSLAFTLLKLATGAAK